MGDYPIQQLYHRGLLADIDIQFADLMARLSGDNGGEALYLACVLLNNIVVRGKHVCLDFDDWSGRSLAALLEDGYEPLENGGPIDFRTPEADDWMRRIARSPAVGAPGDYTPLILDQPGRRLYLYRYWQYEQRLAAGFRERLRDIDIERLKNGLNRCFPSSLPPAGVNWQKIAAFAALTRNICVITGGPGTGKTFTASRIIGLMLEQEPAASIFLCAPTGKAAARLQESMAAARREMTAADAGPAEKFPQAVYTIHRLLGASETGFAFRYHENRHLPADVVIIDEASMVSLSLMARLFSALDQRTRLVLLGDKNQLASVEAGAVFGDICGATAADRFSEEFRGDYEAVCGERLPERDREGGTRLADCVVELKRNFRFPEGSSIDLVGGAVNRGDADETCRVIDHDDSGLIVRKMLPKKEELEDGFRATALDFFEKMIKAATVEEALAALGRFRIICAHRQGVYGVEAVNRLVEKMLSAGGVIDVSEPFYKGRPVIITRNDYALKLYNGDVGIIWNDEAGYRQACFPDSRRPFRTFLPLRLPPHETAYAMTIHKSQGSEFDSLLMILPEKSSPLLTRELVYTGLTRARKTVTIWADDEILKSAVQARVNRRSGLRDALRNVYSTSVGAE